MWNLSERRSGANPPWVWLWIGRYLGQNLENSSPNLSLNSKIGWNMKCVGTRCSSVANLILLKITDIDNFLPKKIDFLPVLLHLNVVMNWEKLPNGQNWLLLSWQHCNVLKLDETQIQWKVSSRKHYKIPKVISTRTRLLWLFWALISPYAKQWKISAGVEFSKIVSLITYVALLFLYTANSSRQFGIVNIASKLQIVILFHRWIVSNWNITFFGKSYVTNPANTLLKIGIVTQKVHSTNLYRMALEWGTFKGSKSCQCLSQAEKMDKMTFDKGICKIGNIFVPLTFIIMCLKKSKRAPKGSQLSWDAEKTIENKFWLNNLQKSVVFCPQIGQKGL